MEIATTVFSMPSRTAPNEEVIEIIRRESTGKYRGNLDHALAIIRRFLVGSGLKERRWCKDGEPPRDHIIAAVEGALDESGLAKKDVELVMYVGVGKVLPNPGTATLSLGR
jgi:3-oxoacyl-[acyl-carrier-protein] synthase III